MQKRQALTGGNLSYLPPLHLKGDVTILVDSSPPRPPLMSKVTSSKFNFQDAQKNLNFFLKHLVTTSSLSVKLVVHFPTTMCACQWGGQVFC